MSRRNQSIIGLLLLFAGVCVADVPVDVEVLRQELTEAREVAAMRAEENERLTAEKAELERELSEMRRRYASLLLATDQTSLKAMEIDLEAAALVRGADEKPSEGVSETGRMLEILAHCRRKVAELSGAMGTHRETIGAILDAAKASNALREQANKSLDATAGSLDDCLETLELATNRELLQTSGSCAVLRLDPATNLAILDQGSLHGIRTGQEFGFQRDNEMAARLKAVVVRPRFTAAILTEGDFNSLAYGVLLKKID